MSRRVTNEPDPTFYQAAGNQRREEQRKKAEAERRRAEAEWAGERKKGLRLLLAVRRLTADAGFELVEDYVVRNRKTGQILRTEGKHDGT